MQNQKQVNIVFFRFIDCIYIFIPYICNTEITNRIIKVSIMTNRRKLKKMINHICSDLFSECVALSMYGAKDKKDDVKAILASIIMVNSNYVRRISHPEPGMPDKVYFKDLKDKFCVQIEEITDTIANL